MILTPRLSTSTYIEYTVTSLLRVNTSCDCNASNVNKHFPLPTWLQLLIVLDPYCASNLLAGQDTVVLIRTADFGYLSLIVYEFQQSHTLVFLIVAFCVFTQVFSVSEARSTALCLLEFKTCMFNIFLHIRYSFLMTDILIPKTSRP